MIIALCSSVKFSKEILETKNSLEKMGHKVELPFMEVPNGDIEHSKMKIDLDLIKKHFKKIEKSDAILVLNLDKNGTKNYIGGNSFLEMGKAFDKGIPIFLLNEIPEISYKDEIVAMRPNILNGDLSKIGK